ncbi:MAG: hypothetical protein K2Q45_06670 [Nitrosomonas sp.]|nr:hypothetical protein [Nitrosomonas sp.]
MHGQENASALFESIENGTLKVNGIFLLAVLNGDFVDERVITTFYCAIFKVAQMDIGYFREWVDKALLQQLPELILDKHYLKSKSLCAKSKKGNKLFFHFDSLCFPNKTLYCYGMLKLENKNSIREKSLIFDLYKAHRAVYFIGAWHGNWMHDIWNLILWLRRNGYHVVLLNRVLPEDSNFEMAWNKFWSDKI